MNHDEIDRRASMIDSENDVRQKAIRAHAALISYFGGEDLTGVIKGVTTDTYAAFIAVLTDSGVSGFETRRNAQQERLREELETAYKDAGFVDANGELILPGRDAYDALPAGSIGPLLPGIVALLEVEHGIDSTEAVREYRPTSLDTIQPDEDTAATTQTADTPRDDWEATIREASGFTPDAAAYVYVLTLERRSDSSRWFYVGKRESGFSGLVMRVRSHARDFNQSRVVEYNDTELLVGDYNASMAQQGTTHRVIDVERIVPISAAKLSAFEKQGAESCYVAEVERRTAYEVAIDHDTTNVLGGK